MKTNVGNARNLHYRAILASGSRPEAAHDIESNGGQIVRQGKFPSNSSSVHSRGINTALGTAKTEA